MHSDDTSPVQPKVADGVTIRWLDPAAAWASAVGADPAGARLAPAILVQASLLFDDRKLGVRVGEDWKAAYTNLGASFDASAPVEVPYADTDLRGEAPTGVGYVLDDAPLDRKTYFSNAEKAIADQLYRTRTHQVSRNSTLKLVAEGDETPDAFAARCSAAATAAAEADKEKLRSKFEARIAKAQDAVALASDRAATAEATEATRRNSALASKATGILGAMFGNRRRNAGSLARDIGSVLGSDGRSEEASRRADTARNQVQRKAEALQALQDDLAHQLAAIDAAWQTKATAVDTADVALKKSDIRITALTLVWVPIT